MAAMCRGALRQGIDEIAFCEHFDCHPDDACTGYYRPDVYFKRLAAVRRRYEPQGLAIRAGVELGEPHRYRAEQRAVLDLYPYDVTLGSLHWVGDHSVFDRAYFRAHSPQEAFAAYFGELAEMARAGGFEVLAHADVIKRMAYSVYGRFEIAEWEDLMRPVWQACIENGIAVEINTAGLRIDVEQPHPSPEALCWYRAMGGELLTLGSDAHRPAHVGCRLADGLAIARAAGFRRLARFEGRQIAGWAEI